MKSPNSSGKASSEEFGMRDEDIEVESVGVDILLTVGAPKKSKRVFVPGFVKWRRKLNCILGS